LYAKIIRSLTTARLELATEQKDGTMDIVKNNLRGADIDPQYVDFRKDFSWPQLEVAMSANETFDFIFIDGQHDASYVMEDLRWTRLLNADGLVCLHDYKPKFPGVK
jgi:predicted O-methyltransferase YrrM